MHVRAGDVEAQPLAGQASLAPLNLPARGLRHRARRRQEHGEDLEFEAVPKRAADGRNDLVRRHA